MTDHPPEVRPCAIQWIGTMPSHWSCRRLKHVASVALSSVDKKSHEQEEAVRLCNYVDVYYNERITSELDFMQATATPDEVRRFTLRSGDVLITKDSEAWDDIAVPAHVPADLEGVLCGYHLAQVRPHNGLIDGEYLSRSFAARGINDQFRVAANGITRFGIGKYWIDNALFLVPPLVEQRAIAAFLDRETERIDTLIEKKRRQIELLHEKRAALISHAVTRGLDPTAPMQDMGIEGLREIPVTWTLKRLKFTTSQVTVGIVVTPSKYYVDEGIPCLRSLNIRENAIVESDMVFITAESNELLRKSKLRQGDLVAVRTGQPGTTAVIDGRFDGANCIDLIIVRRSPTFDSWFMCYVMNSALARSQYLAGATGAIQEHFNIGTAGNMLVPLPPLAEQVQVREFLDDAIGRLLLLAEKVSISIDRLREYRTALISAAVTGKIAVCGTMTEAEESPA